MKKLDQSGAYSFSDAHVLQKSLFRTDRTQEFADNLAQNFRDQAVTPEPIRKFALNETPYTNAKKMLKLLESAGRIEVLARNPKRRRGTFSDDDIVQVRFGNT